MRDGSIPPVASSSWRWRSRRSRTSSGAGEGVEEILAGIEVPTGAGNLEPTDAKFNGPSGVALDDRFIAPLGVTRNDTWLCDVVPWSCCNRGQLAALEREYEPLRAEHGLPEATVPSEPARFADAARCGEVVDEIRDPRVAGGGDALARRRTDQVVACHVRPTPTIAVGLRVEERGVRTTTQGEFRWPPYRGGRLSSPSASRRARRSFSRMAPTSRDMDPRGRAAVAVMKVRIRRVFPYRKSPAGPSPP